MRHPGDIWRLLILLVLLLLWAGAARAEVCQGSKVPRAELLRDDAKARLSQHEIATALATHLPYGQPACPKLLPGREYILCYAAIHRAAL